ncbi:MAG: response regulator [Chitinophagaceae bacterium]|nr:response regulator [Oligoflexus sp.]
MSELELEKKALAGDVESQCSLALLHEIGLDRPQDYEKAAYFLQMAIHSGSQLAWEKLKALCDAGKVSSAWMSDLAQPPAVRPGPETRLPRAGLKLLLLEDEEDLREMLCETLESAGYKVFAAADGDEGLTLVNSHPDLALIITDLKMPKMNGLQFMAAIKKLQLLSEPPLVVMTAYSQQKVIDEGKKLGVAAWIVKPIKKEMLLETLGRILRKKAGVVESL